MSERELVNNPAHYTTHKSGIACWDVNGHLSANLAAAFKYVFRRDDKGALVMDLQKCVRYLEKEIFEIKDAYGRETDAIRFVVQPYRLEYVKDCLSSICEVEDALNIKGFYRSLYHVVDSDYGPTQVVYLNLCLNSIKRELKRVQA